MSVWPRSSSTIEPGYPAFPNPPSRTPSRLLGEERLAQVVALAHIAPHSLQFPRLPFALHPFGHGFHAKGVSKVDDHLHDSRVLYVFPDPFDEPPRRRLPHHRPGTLALAQKAFSARSIRSWCGW